MATTMLQSLVSIGGSLPYDVLSFIFLLCLEGGDTVKDRRTLLAITATCSYWRQVALETPRLWTRISWRTHNDNAHVAPDTPHNLERFSAYLERSKDALLVVSFSIIETYDKKDGVPRWREYLKDDCDEAWNLFCEKHAPRCRSLRFFVRFQNLFKRFDVLPLAAAKFPRLEEVDIDVLAEVDFDEVEAADNRPLFDSRSSAPLKTLHHRIGCDLCEFFTPDVPTAAIERLAISFQLPGYTDDEVDRLQEILQQCPRLIELQLQYLDWSTRMEVEPAQPVTLSNLKALRVSHLWPEEVQAMIRAPNLTSLSLKPKFAEDLGDAFSDEEPENLNFDDRFSSRAMQQLCGGNLRNLELKGNNTPDGLPLSNIRDVLFQNPLITSLRLVQWPLGWSLLGYIHSDRSTLSPITTQKLRLDGESYGEDEDEGESRMEVDGEAWVEATGIDVFMQAPLLPELESLILDGCSFQTLGLSWKDLEALVRAVLQARPQLRICVFTGVRSAFDSLVDEFGQRLRVEPAEASRWVWGSESPSRSDVWWNSVTDARGMVVMKFGSDD